MSSDDRRLISSAGGEISGLLGDVRTILAQARQKTYAAVNFTMVECYWRIGRRIVEEEQHGQQRAEYGARIIRELSRGLTGEFGTGFSAANLKNFRQFYIIYPDFEKSYALRSQLSWTHYRLIMRVENPSARDFYMSEAADQNWSSRILERNINTHYYERLLTAPDKKAALTAQGDFEQHQPGHFIKDPYVLEFLGVPESHTVLEKDIEKAIVSNLQKFLLEMGKGFAFIGRQFRISTETSHFYIDLVFYNYILKCFVLVDLKVGKLTHQDVGQMDMYVRMFDDLKRQPDDNPSIGLILCSQRDETVVRYSVLKESEQLFASKYRLVLPTEEELKEELVRERRQLLEAVATPEKKTGKKRKAEKKGNPVPDA
jgi:predicted nuclease of restriction endonuclease-like (RecB) superfamily